MDAQNLSALLERLDSDVAVRLEAAANKAVALSLNEISVDLFLDCILDKDDAKVLSWVSDDHVLLISELRKSLDFYDPDTRNPGNGLPAFSPRFIQLLQDAWLTASLDIRA